MGKGLSDILFTINQKQFGVPNYIDLNTSLVFS